MTEYGTPRRIPITVAAPFIPFKGDHPSNTDASMMTRAAKNIRNGSPIGGSHVTHAVATLIENAAKALEAPLTAEHDSGEQLLTEVRNAATPENVENLSDKFEQYLHTNAWLRAELDRLTSFFSNNMNASLELLRAENELTMAGFRAQLTDLDSRRLLAVRRASELEASNGLLYESRQEERAKVRALEAQLPGAPKYPRTIQTGTPRTSSA